MSDQMSYVSVGVFMKDDRVGLFLPEASTYLEPGFTIFTALVRDPSLYMERLIELGLQVKFINLLDEHEPQEGLTSMLLPGEVLSNLLEG